MFVQVTAKNVGGVFYETQCIYTCNLTANLTACVFGMEYDTQSGTSIGNYKGFSVPSQYSMNFGSQTA